LVLLALQVPAWPENSEELERDLGLLPDEYQHLAKDLNLKRQAGNERDEIAYCCRRWQFINNDEIHTRMESAQVPETNKVIAGYQDCNGNLNPTRPKIPIPPVRPSGKESTTSAPGISTTTTCMWVPVYKTETHMTTVFNTVTYLVPNSHKYCAPGDFVCCPHYVQLNGNCIHESSVANLEFLIQLGLISGDGIGKR